MSDNVIYMAGADDASNVMRQVEKQGFKDVFIVGRKPSGGIEVFTGGPGGYSECALLTAYAQAMLGEHFLDEYAPRD